ncbi:hypothetical protein DDE74_25785 [Streptomyces lydicus]|uniref:ABC transporter permease n=1 Tax=Streptomyces lydicus TaxID=47763 RepID=A0A3S9YG38_9ACTN|nr:hypothetical protein DDE74_25785 [Streptomyces lydicus]
MPGPSRPDRTRGRAARRWCADLAMGARFAVTGGREGWIRTALTALGVGLGVVVLLLAAAVPNALNAATHRQSARSVVPVAEGTGPSDRSLLTTSSYSAYRELPLHGRILAALAALGTPRAVLGRSVLWQTAVPVALGLALAVGCGLSLGALLLHMIDRPLRLDWWGILTLSGTAAAVILGVTALSLPLLWRLMRPDGLRTE